MSGFFMVSNDFFDVKWLVKDPKTDKERPLRPGERIVYLYFMRTFNKDNDGMWPSHQKIATSCGMSRRGVQDCINTLEYNGLISKRKRFTPDGSRTSNLYHLKPIETLTLNLQNMPYRDYLKTKHWKSLSVQAKIKAEHKCELCYSDKKLNVHHRTYENRGNEKMSDLIVLCEECHAKFHDKMASSS